MGCSGITVETELGWLLRHDLPSRAPSEPPYTAAEVHDALGDLYGCIEVTARRVVAPETESPGAWAIADAGGCGAVIRGALAVPREDWSTAAFAPEAAQVSVEVDAVEVAAGVGANVLGNPLRTISVK